MKNILRIILVVFTFAGCTQEFLEPYRVDPNRIAGENFWKDPILAQGVVNSCYTHMQGQHLFGRFLTVPFVLMTGEAEDTHLTDKDWNEFNTNSVTPGNTDIREFYQKFYEVIRDANDFIDNYDRIVPTATYPREVLTDWLGQAYFFRGYAYWHLVNLWGESNPYEDPNALAVPLVLSVPTTESELYPYRATVGEIYNQIELDYKQAIELIPDDERGEAELGRISKMAIYGLLGKVYLWQQRYDLAAASFEYIFNKNLNTLVYPMVHVYNGENEFGPESLWEFNYSQKSLGLSTVYNYGTFQHFTNLHTMFGFSNFIVSKHAINRFGSDPRLSQSIVMPGDTLNASTKLIVSRFGRPFTKKFNTTSSKAGELDPGWVSNIVILRLSDVFLLYAECQQGLGNDNIALEYVNKVRKRAYNIDYTMDDALVDDAIAYKGLTGIALRDTIREERWRELYYEFHRWYDVKRWRILPEEIEKAKVTSAGIRVYHDIDYYWPIPLNELTSNINLVPSTGYN